MTDQLPKVVEDFKLVVAHLPGQRIQQRTCDRNNKLSGFQGVEHWELGDGLGKGGQGTVCRQTCLDGPRKGTERALKRLKWVTDGHRRPVRELEVMAIFSQEEHSDLFVQMIGYYFDRKEKDLCIAMELLPNGDIESHVKEHGCVSEEEARQIISQVLRGLSRMHERGFAHRDIKPQNVLIQDSSPLSWSVKLADFGLSKRTDTQLSTANVGTPAYMAPEVRRNTNKDVDRKAGDLWSVGVLAFHLLTGQGEAFTDIWRKQLIENPNVSVYGNPTISTSGVNFILQMTAEVPSERRNNGEGWLESRAPVEPGAHARYLSYAPPGSSISSSSDAVVVNTVATLPTSGMELHSMNALNADDDPLHHVRKADDSHLDQDIRDLYDDLGEAASEGDMVDLRRLIASLTVVDRPQGETALFAAARNGHLEAVERLVAAAADVRRPNVAGLQPAHVAASGGHVDIVQHLVRHGADVNAKGHRGLTALHDAASHGHAHVVAYLASQNADVDAQSNHEETALYQAASKGYTEIVTCLLDARARTEIKNSWGETALHGAISGEHSDVVKALVRNGADINAINRLEVSPLHVAAKGGSPEILEYLLNQNASEQDRHLYDENALHVAAALGNIQNVKILVASGYDIMNTGGQRGVPIDIAAKNRKNDVVEFLNHQLLATTLAGYPSKDLNFVGVPDEHFKLPISLSLQNYQHSSPDEQSLRGVDSPTTFTLSKDSFRPWPHHLRPALSLWLASTRLATAGRFHINTGLGNPLTSNKLSSVFQIADLHEPGLVSDRPFSSVLGIQLSSNSELINLYFTLPGMLSPPTTRLEQQGQCDGFIWKEKAMEKECRVFHLLSHGQAVCSPLLEGEWSSDDDSAHPILAVLSVKGSLDSGSFDLRFFEIALSSRGFLAITVTALEVWRRITDNELSRRYLEDEITEAGRCIYS